MPIYNQRFNANLRILDPVQTGTGTPGFDLQSIDTTDLPSGSFCYVSEDTAGEAGEWQYEKDATDVPDGLLIIQPSIGPGRWFHKFSRGISGGHGPITSVTGVNGINVPNPTGPAVTVDGIALLPKAQVQYVSVLGPTAITDTFHTHCRVDTAAGVGTYQVTLPPAAIGKMISVKDVGGSANSRPIEVSGQPGELIDGAPLWIVQTDYGAVRLIGVASGAGPVWDIL